MCVCAHTHPRTHIHMSLNTLFSHNACVPRILARSLFYNFKRGIYTRIHNQTNIKYLLKTVSTRTFFFMLIHLKYVRASAVVIVFFRFVRSLLYSVVQCTSSFQLCEITFVHSCLLPLTHIYLGFIVVVGLAVYLYSTMSTMCCFKRLDLTT